MATTPNYSFSVYSSTDTDVRFLDFRVATAGSQSTSNFYVIDTVLKQHSDAIDSINATPSAFVVKGTYSAGSLYTASVANYPGYKNEQLIVLSLNQKNTGAVQININGTTNKDVMKYGSDGVLKAVEAGDFVANSPVLCLYDGTRFVVIGITSASSITVTGETGDILQIADDGTIESSGKKAAQPNGIATLDENGNVVQVANMANSAAAVYSGEPVTVEYAGENRIGSVTAYGNNPQTSGTTTAPISMSGVDSVQVSGNNLFLNNAVTETKSGITFTVNTNKSITVNGTNSTSGSAVFYTGYNESLPAGSYTLSGASSLTGSAEIEIKIKRVRGTFEWFSINSSLHTRTLNIATGDIIDSFYVTVRAGQTADNVTVYPMLNVGSTALPYEPYQGSVTQLPIPRPLRRVGDVRDVCVTRQEYEGAEKLVVTYNVGYIASYAGESITTAWISSTGALSTGAEVAYVLSSPEVYATDPLTIDNAAGPLTVVTGGQVEVKMTDFVTDRTPAFLNKLDKTGDGSDVTVTFTEATEDADIASSDKLSILFGKILKRFSTITSKFTTVEGDISDIVDGTTTVANATTAATANKVKNKLSLLSGGGKDTIIYDGSTAIAAAMNSGFIGAEPAFTKNSAFNKNFGSSAGTVCQGNDSRLSNARRSSNISMSLSGTNLSISYS